ncbi:MAG: tetratricopeptide repeat protein [Candidatus Omnitrophica bacterium]|nr:tetratricopeptide repeat protein [Candidatus Omnitrophota bacterium]
MLPKNQKEVWQNNRVFFPAIFLAALILLAAYVRSFNAAFHYDDNAFIVDNPHIKNLRDILSADKVLPGGGRFLGFGSFALNYYFHQTRVFGYHLVNFLLHAANAVLAGCLAYMLVKLWERRPSDPTRSLAAPTAFFTAVLFALHPAQTAAVTYISQRFTSLASFFYLASLGCYLRGRFFRPGRKRLWLTGALALAGAGIGAKEMTVTLPLAIGLVEILHSRPEPGTARPRRANKSLLPLGLLAAAVVWVLLATVFKGYFTAVYQSGSHDGERITFGPYVLTQLRVWVVYLRNFFFPFWLNVDYDFPLSRSVFDPAVWSSALLLAGLAAVALVWSRDKKILAFSLLWFFFVLSCEMIPRKFLIFDHKLYLPSVGLCLGLAYAVLLYLPGKRAVILLSAIVCLWAGLTFQRNLVWQDEITLWSDALAKSPGKYDPHLNLGIAYLQKGDYDRAKILLDQAARILPDGYGAYNNRGVLYFRIKRYPEALADFNRALRLNPHYAKAFNNRGALFAEMKEYDKAAADFSQALALAPGAVQVYQSRQKIFQPAGRDDLILQDLDRILAVDPFNASALANRGMIYAKLGQARQAMADFSQAIKINPKLGEVYINRGALYRKEGDLSAALADFNKAVEVLPWRSESYMNRGGIFADQQSYAAALRDYGTALLLDSRDGKIYYNRALVYRLLGRYQESIADLTQALEIEPGNWGVLSLRATIYGKIQQWKLAIADLDQVIRQDPANAKAFLKRSLCYQALGQKDQARVDAIMARHLGLNVEPEYLEQLH